MPKKSKLWNKNLIFLHKFSSYEQKDSIFVAREYLWVIGLAMSAKIKAKVREAKREERV